MRLKFDPNPTSWRGGGGRPPPGPRDRPCPTPRSGGSPATPSPISPLGRCPLWPPGLLRVLASLSHPLSTPQGRVPGSARSQRHRLRWGRSLSRPGGGRPGLVPGPPEASGHPGAGDKLLLASHSAAAWLSRGWEWVPRSTFPRPSLIGLYTFFFSFG